MGEHLRIPEQDDRSMLSADRSLETWILWGCGILLAFELLLGLAHLLWPEYNWGQGRRSWFHFNNSLTLASWLASMQLVVAGMLGIACYWRSRARKGTPAEAVKWIAMSCMMIGMSFVEITKIHDRLKLAGFPNPDPFERIALFSLIGGALVLEGAFLLHRGHRMERARIATVGWLSAWGLATTAFLFEPILTLHYPIASSLVTGLAWMFGCTLLLTALALQLERQPEPVRTPVAECSRKMEPGILFGIAGTAFIVIILQVVLFRLLTVFGDYLIANSVISIALLGIAAGGLVASRVPAEGFKRALYLAVLAMPFTVLLTLGACVMGAGSPYLTSVLLALPFMCCGTIITLVLANTSTRIAYGIDLLGAAAGALLVSPALTAFREENTLLLLTALAILVALSFYCSGPRKPEMRTVVFVAVFCLILLVQVAAFNTRFDWMNMVEARTDTRYPDGEILYSESSLAGRYDVIRLKPNSTTLKALENGRIIDTIRPRGADRYRIDPRLPHTLIDEPVILILGVSGDGIAKTARSIGSEVYGVEINPAIVALQTGALQELNGDSYEDIDIAIMDGRNYVDQSDRKYDMITLLNAHFARGSTPSRAQSTEYLHTVEGVESYLDHLTDRGVLIYEEPVNRPEREPPVWKLLATQRQALLSTGNTDPGQHFFIFQWKTSRNNYVQILVKKTPFTGEEIGRLHNWLYQVDHIDDWKDQQGRSTGPIHAATTVLHSPGTASSSNYSRIVSGSASAAFLAAHNLDVVTDNRPFLFDVNPRHSGTGHAYGRTILIAMLLLPLLGYQLARYRWNSPGTTSFVLASALTGVGYFLVEVVLIQMYGLYLGSPVTTFSTVLGSMLLFSGAGCLVSRYFRNTGIVIALLLLLGTIIIHLLWVPDLLRAFGGVSLVTRVSLSVASIAPLAFLLGIPLPHIMRTARQSLDRPVVALLFAINSITSALAVPLALSLAMQYGFQKVFLIAALVYIAACLAIWFSSHRRLHIPVSLLAMVVLVVLLVSPWLDVAPAMADVPSETSFTVHAMSYGKSRFPENRAMEGSSSRKRVQFEWMFWLLQGDSKTILVDTGCDDRTALRSWDIKSYVQPVQRLSKLGVSPEEVTDIILTHLHWDHAGGLAAYSSATIWIQEEEYRYAIESLADGSSGSHGMRRRDLDLLQQAEQDGRLRLVHGTRQLTPGIVMSMNGAHSPGSQHVTVETLDGAVIIGGDTTYLYGNSQQHRPTGSAWDRAANLEAIRIMHEQAASPFLILPGHDPRVMKWFPKLSEGIVRIRIPDGNSAP